MGSYKLKGGQHYGYKYLYTGCICLRAPSVGFTVWTTSMLILYVETENYVRRCHLFLMNFVHCLANFENVDDWYYAVSLY